ncbi:helix-turn-helix domain-containing protein [Acidisoma sp. L85]|uniref:helix-turn-helix domain-containing protein n=1 Tax=Acidisoma sp. L85 TaxID=1641850 RepID=UPI00131D2193
MTGDYDCTTGTAPRRLVAPPAHQQLGRSQLSGRHSRLTLRFVTLENEEQQAVLAALRAGDSVSELARHYGTSRQTIMRLRDAEVAA